MSADTPTHLPIPVKGYRPQSSASVAVVNVLKESEEHVLQILDRLQQYDEYDKRWLAIGRTYIEQGYMAMVRAIFKPERVKLTSVDE